jgi:hypothetical protein
MNGIKIRITIAVTGLLLVADDIARADDDIEWVTTSRGRYEIAIGAHSWPGIAELQSARGGRFDEVGFNLNLAGHWPLWRFDNSELLVGLDLGLFSNDSDIRFVTEDIYSRNGYLTPSVKWMFGSHHRYSIDAGIGYYLLDMVELAGEYPMSFETQLWEESTVGGYVGATIDIGGGDPGRNRGVMLSFKTHFVDFGVVRDENALLPQTLGPNAGDLSGPVYMAQIGYRWR